jgi:hypothetical protein
VDREVDLFEVLGGPYAGETVTVIANGVSHQGFDYVRQ